jgi:hypothetical protein
VCIKICHPELVEGLSKAAFVERFSLKGLRQAQPDKHVRQGDFIADYLK